MLGLTRLAHGSGGRGGRGQMRGAAAALVALTLLLGACSGGKAAAGAGTPTTGVVVIGSRGTLAPGTLRWGTDATASSLPYIMRKDANNPQTDYYGFEVDLANAIGKLMAVSTTPVPVAYGGWPQDLRAQKFDMFMDGLEITQENAESATFSIPYYVYTESIVVLDSNTSINGFSDLAGKRVETGTGYQAQAIMESYNAANPGDPINIITTANPIPFSDLLAGRVDAVFIDTPIAEWYGANDPSGKFKIAGQPSNPGYYGIAFNRSDPNTLVLKREVNAAIAQLWLNGTLKRIYDAGGAYSAGADTQPVFEKYDMWSDLEQCIGNFVPAPATVAAGCPELPPN